MAQTTWGEFDVALAFYTDMTALDSDIARLKSAIGPTGILWIAYPKGTAKVKTDLNRDILRLHLQEAGLQSVALVAIDDTWSAIRLKRS